MINDFRYRFAFLFVAGVSLSGRAALAGNQILANSEPTVLVEINLIEEIFGDEAMQTEVNEMDLTPKFDSFEQVLLAHASNKDSLTAESALGVSHLNSSICVPIASVVCNKTMSACDLAGDSE